MFTIQVLLSVNYSFVECTYSRTEITCTDLPTLMVSYNGGSPDIRPVDTGATYSCSNGYTLIGGDASRVCVNGGSWSGSIPTCQGELCTLSTTWVHWFNSCRTHWTSTHYLSWPHCTNQWSDNLQSNNHPQTRGNSGYTDLLEWIRTLHYQHCYQSVWSWQIMEWVSSHLSM